jgi:ABC-type transport system involved in multi-copper enzyme maturation permease subunit
METFLLLRRHKIFLTTTLLGLIAFSLINISSDWGNMEFYKILFYFSAFVYVILGVVVAILWGSQIIRAGDGQGSQDIPLSSPLSRGEYLVGRFSGVFATLALIAILFLATIQLNMAVNNFGWLTAKQLWTFLMLTWIWWVLAAVTVFLRTFCSATLTMSIAFMIFVIGLITQSIAASLPQDTPYFQRVLFTNLARIWNLQEFNFTSEFFTGASIDPGQLWETSAYGMSWIIVLLSAGALVFRKADL